MASVRDQWAGRTSPGVATLVVSGRTCTSQQLKTPGCSVTCLRTDLYPTCADSSSFASSAHHQGVPAKCQGPDPSGDSPRGAPSYTRSDNAGVHRTRTEGRHRHRPRDASLVPSSAKGVKTEHGFKACVRNAAVLKEDTILYFERDALQMSLSQPTAHWLNSKSRLFPRQLENRIAQS